MSDGTQNTMPIMAKDKSKTDEELDEDESEDAEDTEEESEDEESEEESEEGSDADSTSIDFKAETEKEKSRGKPDPDIARKAFLERKGKKADDGNDEDEDDDEDKPMSKREAREFLARESQRAFKSANAERILELARGMADSEDEAQYIVALHTNREFPTNLPLTEQVEECHAIANRKRLNSKNSELARALKGKKGVNKSGTGGYQDPQKGPAPKVKADMAGSLKRAGFVLDNKDRKWKKKLPNGNYLVKDTPTSAPKLVRTK